MSHHHWHGGCSLVLRCCSLRAGQFLAGHAALSSTQRDIAADAKAQRGGAELILNEIENALACKRDPAT